MLPPEVPIAADFASFVDGTFIHGQMDLEVSDMLSVVQLEVKDLIQTLVCLELVVFESVGHLDT